MSRGRSWNLAPESNRLDDLKIDRDGAVREGTRRWPILVIVGGIAIALAVVFGLLRGREVAEVRTAAARELRTGTQETVLDASGYVTARRQATVSSKVTGKVLEVLIEEGMTVDEGQVLARLDPSNVGANLRLAQAQLASARTARRETEVRWKEAQLELSRVSKLVDQQISSQAELDVSQAEVDSLAARSDRQLDEVAVAQQQVRLWEQELEDLTIRAPFQGVVVAKNAQPGEMISPVSAGGGFTRTGIGTIVDMTSLEIEVDVNEAYINRVRSGQGVVATLDAYPDWKIPCEVIAIIPTADRQKATVQVRIGFSELDPRVLPDMGVKVAFQDTDHTERPVKGVLTPKSALRMDGDQEVVLVVVSDRVERRAVHVARESGQEVMITAGLSAGEPVIVEGPQDLADGYPVKEIRR